MSDLTVIIPTYRNPKYLRTCLESAVRGIGDGKIIVVVDGFVEESREIIDRYESDQIGFLELEENRGMATAINLGVWNADTEYVFVINDDNVFPTLWYDRLCAEIDRAKKFCHDSRWVLTVDQIEPTGPGMYNFHVKDLGKTWDDFDVERWQDYEYIEHERSSELELTGGIFPFIVSKKMFMLVGGFDTFYCSPQVVDYDLFLKWSLMNSKFIRTRNIKLYHFGSVVTRKNDEAPRFRQAEAQAVGEYEYKWGARLHNEPGTNNKIPPDGKFRGFTHHV